MGALKTEHFFSKCGGDKGKKQKKKKKYLFFFVDRSNSEPLTSHYHLGPTPARVCNYHHYPLENRIVCKFKIRSDQKCWVLERVFCSCVTSLRGGWGEEKTDLSFNGQLMMSYHYTQILRSPSKAATLSPDWLLCFERGRVIFFPFFPSCSWINSCASVSSSLLFSSLM